MSATPVHPAEVPRRSTLAHLVAQGMVAAVGLALGAVVGLIAALWLGLIDIVC